MNEPNASICHTFLANWSPPTTNEAQVEFDHRMLCTLGTFKKPQTSLDVTWMPSENQIHAFIRQGHTISLLRFGMIEELKKKLQPMMRRNTSECATAGDADDGEANDPETNQTAKF